MSRYLRCVARHNQMVGYQVPSRWHFGSSEVGRGGGGGGGGLDKQRHDAASSNSSLSELWPRQDC